MVRNTQPEPYAGLGPDDWWHAEVLAEADSPERLLSDDQVSRFREAGFIVVDGLWPAALMAQACAEAATLHPAATVAARSNAGERQNNFSEMPWLRAGDAAPDTALNHMTIHPRVLSAVAQLLGVSALELRLSQSHVIAKHGRWNTEMNDGAGGIVGDQDIHVDYGNNTLLVPPRTTPPEAVACLCYYSDVDECGGATHFVEAAPGELDRYEPSLFNPPNFVAGTDNGSAATESGPRAPALVEARYRAEKPVRYRKGVCVLYRLDAWHRGTPVARDAVRHTHHHVWRRAGAEWVNWQSLAPRMAGMPTRFLASLSVVQRTVLGFAAPGDPYWTAETVDAVGQRYPRMDMTPYWQALGVVDTGD